MMVWRLRLYRQDIKQFHIYLELYTWLRDPFDFSVSSMHSARYGIDPVLGVLPSVVSHRQTQQCWDLEKNTKEITEPSIHGACVQQSVTLCLLCTYVSIFHCGLPTATQSCVFATNASAYLRLECASPTPRDHITNSFGILAWDSIHSCPCTSPAYNSKYL